MIITFIHFPSSASHPLLPWAAGRHVARKGRGTLNRSWQCFFVSCSVKNCVHPWPSITRPQQYSISHLSDSIINNPSKTSPSTNSINSQFCLHLPIFWHVFPSPSILQPGPGTEGLLLALRPGPGGGLAELDRGGAHPLGGFSLGRRGGVGVPFLRGCIN